MTAEPAAADREDMEAGRYGKRAAQLQWLGLAAILFLSAIQKAQPVLSALAGYCTLILVRDAFTLNMARQADTNDNIQ